MLSSAHTREKNDFKKHIIVVSKDENKESEEDS